MMGRALLIVGFMSTLGVIAAAVAGYTLHGPTDANMPLHVLIALASSLLLLFSHCWIMFYLIGTGKAIKDAVRENGLDLNIIEETKRFKNESYPSLMLAMGLVMATFIVGGGVATGAVSRWIHHGLFYLAAASKPVIVMVPETPSGRGWIQNERLMVDVDRRLATAGK